MRDSLTERPRLPLLKAVRAVIVIPIVINVILVALAVYVAVKGLRLKYPKAVLTSVFFLASVTLVRLIWVIINGLIQARTASVMIVDKADAASIEGESGNKSVQEARRRWYRLWLWWNRVGTLVLSLQFVAACLIVRYNNDIQRDGNEKRPQIILMVLPVATLVVVIVGWFTGSEVLSWRTLYTHKSAWRAHYSEAFRCCIREALCCMGRYHYLGKDQKEEVYSVASLLGHLVSYRAQGCTHLEVLAGMSLLRDIEAKTENPEPAPEDRLREASVLHTYAVAAYTGPLLELGRYPHCWLLVWLHSQGFWTFWKRSRRPVLEGDNLWRGHAASFLRHARLPAKALRKGRVLQKKRESAYFVVVLHELRTVVVAVRGTETPDDLLTDGLSRETPLSESDLLGLLKNPHLSNEVKGKEHYAHSGIIEAARELSFQLDNLAEDDNDAMAASDMTSIEGLNEEEVPKERTRGGLLTELFGPKGDCQGYQLRLVGHSLGGSVCSLTGLRLYKRYPNLHVYAFGALPCVDDAVADACREFMTCVVYHDEFSSRLSVASMMRLRGNAEKALLKDTKSERVQRRLENLQGQRLHGSSPDGSDFVIKSDSTIDIAPSPESPSFPGRKKYSELRKAQRLPYMIKGGVFLCAHTCFCVLKMSQHHKSTAISSEVNRCVHTLSTQQSSRITSSKSQWQCMGNGNSEREFTTSLVPPALFSLTGSDGLTGSEDKEADENLRERYPAEMYLPGQVIHIVRKDKPAKSWWLSFWNAWQAENEAEYSAVLADRLQFRDIIISPSMFVDHMPWKCQRALNLIVSKLPT